MKLRWGERDRLTDRPDHALVGVVRMPASQVGPLESVSRRVLGGIVAVLGMALLVYLDRDGYVDDSGRGGLTLLDCVYYASVSLTTTGYGDITPAATRHGSSTCWW